MGARGRHTPVLAARHCVALPGHPLPSASVSSSVTWGPQQACVWARVTEAKCSRRAPSTRSRHLSLSPRFEFLVCGGESGEASLLGRGAAWEQPLRSCTGVPPPSVFVWAQRSAVPGSLTSRVGVPLPPLRREWASHSPECMSRGCSCLRPHPGLALASPRSPERLSTGGLSVLGVSPA